MKRKTFLASSISALTLALAVAGGASLTATGVSAQHSDGNGFISNRLEDKLENAFSDERPDCTLSAEQVAELDAFFKVKTFELDVDGQPTTVAAVKGKHLTKAQLKAYLGVSDAELDCSITRHKHWFFLPVQPSA